MIGSWLFQLFGYRDRVTMRMISLVSVTILYIQSLTTVPFDLNYWWFRGLKQIGNDERTSYWFTELMVYCTGLPWHRLVFDVYDDCIKIISWWIHYCYYPVWVDEMLISFIWDSTFTRRCRTVTSINSCYWKLLGKYYLIITPCTILLFIVYTDTDAVHCYCYCSPCIRLLLLSPNCPSILVT